MKKFLALFDLHFGYEYGNGIVRPTHNLKLVKAVNKFTQDFWPDILILGGDNVNCGPISHWHKGKPRLNQNFKLKDEYELLETNILEPYRNVDRKIWLTGNHEAWIEDHVNEHPGLEGLIETKSYIPGDWEYYNQGAIVKIGKLYFTHGDTILGSGKYVNPAEQLLKQTRVNVRCGHLHSYYAATDFNPIKSNDYHTAIVVPCMCSTNTFYMKNRPSKVLNGFLYGYIEDNGNFWDQVVIAVNNKFVVNGIKYE